MRRRSSVTSTYDLCGSVVAMVVNDSGIVGGDLVLCEKRQLDFITDARHPSFTEVHLHGHVSFKV